ncbi:hypothetical protein [Paludisphaera rhizosphaerae]|uniref:hypothetical protein n=1 Tax=Paludisphaera rhizosphaerae TaxID=2711216 RepID=UPI0013EB1670|nr:hypothetical protein [Paludisphaera rhizosphaerae]
MRTYLAAAVAAFALLFPSFAHAEPITYVLDYTNVDIGIGSQVFRNGSITLTLRGDTRDVGESFNRFGPLYSFQGPLDYAIAGGPSGTAYYDARIVYQAYSGVFQVDTNVGGGTDLFSTSAIAPPPFLNYQLKTTYDGGAGPVSVPSGGITLRPTGGGIGVFSTSTSTVRFRSIVTPEPSSIVMGGIGVVGGLLAGYRRSHGR